MVRTLIIDIDTNSLKIALNQSCMNLRIVFSNGQLFVLFAGNLLGDNGAVSFGLACTSSTCWQNIKLNLRENFNISADGACALSEALAVQGVLQVSFLQGQQKCQKAHLLQHNARYHLLVYRIKTPC